MTLPRINEIISVGHDYSVLCKWTTGELRVIQFQNKLDEWKNRPSDIFNQLADLNRFMQVKTNGITLYWENGMTMKDENGQIIPCELDLDPDLLYELSKPIN